MPEVLAVGKPLLQSIELVLQAGQPFALVGPHGIGKSELLEQAAKAQGMKCIVRDLSLMEPVDLVGLPVFRSGKTSFSPPSFLPEEGRGLLVMEELNRAPRHVITPCLQLLTARKLNDYVLPPGWTVAATWNEGEEYHVQELDPALRSRFVILHAEASVAEWLSWAKAAKVPEPICTFIEKSSKVFQSSSSNPRAWHKAGAILKSYEGSTTRVDDQILLAALSGCLGDTWARSFLKYYLKREAPLAARDVLEDFEHREADVARWVAEKRLDLLKATFLAVLRFLEKEANFTAIRRDRIKRGRLSHFIRLLPPDFRDQYTKWCEDRGYPKSLLERK